MSYKNGIHENARNPRSRSRESQGSEKINFAPIRPARHAGTSGARFFCEFTTVVVPRIIVLDSLMLDMPKRRNPWSETYHRNGNSHAASSYGVPVLVDRAGGAAYGRGQVAGLLHALDARAGRRLLDALLRLADDPEGRQLIDRFLQEGGVLED
jgi:hypothetical protein